MLLFIIFYYNIFQIYKSFFTFLMDNQKKIKNEVNIFDISKKTEKNKSNKFLTSVINKKLSLLYKQLIKEGIKTSIIIPKKRNSYISNKGLPLKTLKNIYKLPKNCGLRGLSAKDALYLGLDFNKKSVKSNDIYTYLSSSNIYHPRENKLKILEKNIQSKLLDISMEIYEQKKTHIKSELSDEESFEKKPKKIKKLSKSSKKVDFQNMKDKMKGFKKDLSNFKKTNSVKSHDTSVFLYLKEQQMERERKIRRSKVLYDSMAEDESDENIDEEGFGLNPESIFIIIFDFFLFFCSFFCLFYMPLRLAMNKLEINNDEYLIYTMIYFSEILYIFDLIFGFLRWYYNNVLKLVRNNYIIIKHYLYGYFFIDLIQAIPFYSILKYINSKYNDNNKYTVLFNEKHFMIKLLVCLKALKIFKINNRNNNKAIYFINKYFSDSYISERIYNISNLAIITLSVLNIFVCFHIYIGKLSYPNWILSTKVQDKSFLDIYLSSLYFIIATMTSVGYGDIVCISNEETFFQILLLSIGIVAYSWIINTVGDYVKNESRASIKYNKDLTQLEEIRIAYPNMPFKLYNNIHQHLQRLLRQQEKFDSNILINSLPYTLKNKLLFVIHKEVINKFIFFKGCENSDFIIKVLTRFIPLYSKKNSFLIKEGEIIENIFLVKDGKLALEAAIDLDNIEKSVEKYLEYQFEDISSIVESNSENSFQKLEKLLNDEKEKIEIKNHEELLDVINKLSQNIENISYMHETHIEEEIGKCDFNEECEDLEQGNHQFLHILDILKNEHFGEIYMILNKPCPLSLRVKSKKADLFLLRKKDVINVKKDYPNIWKRIEDKAMYNMKSIKALTKKIINRYCKFNGIIQEKDIMERSNHLFECKDSICLQNKNMSFYSNNSNIKKSKIRAISTSVNKNSDIKKKKSNDIYILSSKSNKQNNSFRSCPNKNKEKSKTKKNGKEEKIAKIKESFISNTDSNQENKNKKEKDRILNLNESQYTSKTLSFNESNKSLNEKININKNIKDKKSKTQQNKNNEKKEKNKKSKYKSSKLKENNSNFKTSYKTNITKDLNSKNSSIFNNDQINKSNQNLTQFNNLVISNTNLLYFIPESFHNINNNSHSVKSNNNNLLIKEMPIKLEYISNYKNINQITKGKYINNKKFQNALYKFIKFYFHLNVSQSNKKNDNKESSFDFSSLKKNSKNELFIDNDSSNNCEKSEIISNKYLVNSNNEFSKNYSFSENIVLDENKKNKNKIKLIKYNNTNTKSKVLSKNFYKEDINNYNNNLKSIILDSNKNDKNKTKDRTYTPKLKYKNNNKIKKYNLDDKNTNNENSNQNDKTWKKIKNSDILPQNKMINFNFHISDKNISLENRKKEIIPKINDKMINNDKNNLTKHVINSNSNNIINETNYNYTKNYCFIY